MGNLIKVSVLTLFLSVNMTSCSFTEDGTADLPDNRKVDIEKNIEPAEKETEKISEEAEKIDREKENIEEKVEDTQVESRVVPHTENIGSSVSDIKTSLVTIGEHFKALNEKQRLINRKDEIIEELRNKVKNRDKRIEELKSEQNKWLQSWLNWLQIGGIVVAGLGFVAGVALKRIKLGAITTLSGIGIATAARMWSEYAWIFVIALTIVALGLFGYTVWYAVERRKAIFRQVFNLRQSKTGQKVIEEEKKREEFNNKQQNN